MNHDPFSPSRRDFLAGAASVAAGTLAASALGAGRAPRREEPRIEAPVAKAAERVKLEEGGIIRIGVIGIGGQPGACAMGLGHCRALVNINNKKREKVQVVAICDLNRHYLEQGKSELERSQPGVKVEAYQRSGDLLARDDIHGVIVATPEHWHSANSIEAILAGKDVYVEKPMTLNLEMAAALRRVAAANPQVIVQVGAQKTRQPKFLEARKMIREGRLGVPTLSQTSYGRNVPGGEWRYGFDAKWKPGVDVDWDTWCGPLGSMPWDPKLFSQWRRYRKTSTGIIGDLLVHQITPMMLALDQGWPVRVIATGAHLVDKEMDNPDNVTVEAQFETGHTLLVTGSTCNEAGLETLIRCHKGNIYLGDRHCVMRPERVFSEEIEPAKVECADIGDDQDAHRMGWLRSIRTREQPDSSVELGFRVMVVVDLAARSMHEGGAFVFDPRTLTSRKA